MIINITHLQQQKKGLNNYFYEPFLFVTEAPEIKDSWNMIKGIWYNNKKYSLNLEVEISN